MRRRSVLAAAGLPVLGGCSAMLRSGPSYGLIIEYDILPGASFKYCVTATSDTGARLFSPGQLTPRPAIGRHSGGGRNSSGGRGLPRSARVTWRTDDCRMEYSNASWIGGTIVGDYHVEIASRIPLDVLDYAGAVRGRALRLVFWLMDDGVLLAWDVEQLPEFRPWKNVMHGGDFVEPVVVDGKLIAPGWYLDREGRKVVIDR